MPTVHALTLPSGRIRVWSKVTGRRVQRTYGPPPTDQLSPRLWAAGSFAAGLGLTLDPIPIWRLCHGETLAYRST